MNHGLSEHCLTPNGGPRAEFGEGKIAKNVTLPGVGKTGKIFKT